MECNLVFSLGDGDNTVYRLVEGKRVDLTPKQIQAMSEILSYRAEDLAERQALERINAGQLYYYVCDDPYYVVAGFDAVEGMVFYPADKYGVITDKKPILIYPVSRLVAVKSQGSLADAASFLDTELVPAF